MNEEIARIEQWIEEVLDQIQGMIQAGEVLPDELYGQVADAIQDAQGDIELLMAASQGQPERPPERPPLASPMPSSNIHSFGYDDKNNRLYVKFQGDYPQENGAVYSYDGVPKVIFDLFKAGAVPAKTNGKNDWGSWWKGKYPSLGSALYHLIKIQGYNYNKLS